MTRGVKNGSAVPRHKIMLAYFIKAYRYIYIYIYTSFADVKAAHSHCISVYYNYSPSSAFTRRKLLDQQPQELQMMWSLTPNQRRYNRGSCEGWREGEEEEKGRREGSREGGGGDGDSFFISMRERKRERGRGRGRGREKTHCFFHLLPSGGTRTCLPGWEA